MCIFYVYKKKKKIPVKIILLIVYVANLNRSFNESLCNILTNKTCSHSLKLYPIESGMSWNF